MPRRVICLGASGCDVAAGEMNAAARRFQIPCHHVYECCFACTIRTDQTSDAVLIDAGGNIVRSGYRAKGFHQPARFENGTHADFALRDLNSDQIPSGRKLITSSIEMPSTICHT